MRSITLQALVLASIGYVLSAPLSADEPAAEVVAAEKQRIQTIAEISRAAVAVLASDGRGGGSGVVISPDGFALTNYHVVQPAGDYMMCSMSDGHLYDAVIVGIDPTGDVALIKLLGRNDFPTARFGDSDRVQVGDWCYVIGNPFLLATDFQPSVSYGMISGTHRYQPPAGTLLEYTDCLQTDAAVNPGNSGGPLFDSNGRLIGINGRCSFEKRGRVNVGVGYAISINQIKNFLGYLHSGRIVDHATLGATMTSNDDGQVVVEEILDDSDAFRRGMRYDDPIISFAGRRISTVNGFKNVLGIFPRGWRIPIQFEHDGESRTAIVRLSGVHSPEELLRKLRGAPPPPSPRGPAPKQPNEKQDDAPKQPKKRKLPQRVPHGRAKTLAPPPDHVAKYLKKRPGFANYFFNELNRDRVWESFKSQKGELGRDQRCVVHGNVTGNGSFKIELSDSDVSGHVGSQRYALDISSDFDQQLVPEGTGGLLVALHLWHRMLTVGPRTFGDTYYLGTVPFMEKTHLHDVLVGTHNVTETRFIFDPKTGHLTALEMYPGTLVDPCELVFGDYREDAGRKLPYHILVRYGDEEPIELIIEGWELPTMTKEIEPKGKAIGEEQGGGSRATTS